VPGNALFEPAHWTHPGSKKLQRVCDRWYSLGVIFGNRGGMLGCGHFPPYIRRTPRRYWNSASVIVPADAGIQPEFNQGPISRAIVAHGLPGIGL
jgi:hypothetical protein